eukprot:799355_1
MQISNHNSKCSERLKETFSHLSMASDLLKQENDQLKKQLTACQKQIAHYKEQLDALQKQIQSKSGHRHKSGHHHKKNALPSRPIHRKTENIVKSFNRSDAASALKARFEAKNGTSKPMKHPNGIERSVNRNDAANALMAKFGAKKQSKPVKPPNGIEGAVDRNDAANALLSKFAALKKPKPPSSANSSSKPNHKATFKKYEIMLKVGVDLSGVLTQMKKDNLDPNLMEIFKKSHGGTDEDDTKEETDPIKLGLPAKPTLKPPKQSMKRLHWTPVKLQKIMHSVWSKVDQQWNDYKVLSFELKFQTRTMKPKLARDALKQNVNDAEDEKQQQVKFVSDKRSQQVQIGLRSYHMTNNDLRQMILSLDDTKLDIDNLIGLIDIIPTPEEQLQAEKASQEKNISNFGVAERFFYSLYDIIELGPRFKKWLFKLQFEDKVDRVEQQMVLLERSKIAVTHSQNLQQILSILLAFGNHMNYGNKLKGNCYGFHLTDLALLPQIKTFDNSMTFPMFLYDFIARKKPKLLNIFDELSIVDQASGMDIDTVEKLYDELVKEMKDLRAMINRYKEEYFEVLSEDDLFIRKISAFETTAKKRMWGLKFKYDSLHKCQRNMIDYFAYDSEDKSMNMTKILKDLNAFLLMLQNSKTKLDDLERQRKKKNAQRLREQNKRKRRKSNEFEKLLNTRNTQIAKGKQKESKRFAVGFEDIGTPLAKHTPHNARQTNVTFSTMVMEMNVRSTASPPLQPIDDNKATNPALLSRTRSTTYSNLKDIDSRTDLPRLELDQNNIKMKPKPQRNAPKLKLNSLQIHVRRGSDPTTPVTPSLLSPKRRKKAQRKGKIKSNGFGVSLLTSDSKLTPCGAQSHANVDESFGVTIAMSPKKRKKMNQKTTSDISMIKQQRVLKRRSPSYKKIPAKRLPKTPIKVRNY